MATSRRDLTQLPDRPPAVVEPDPDRPADPGRVAETVLAAGPDRAASAVAGEGLTAPIADAAPPTFDQLYEDEYDAMVRVAYLLVGSVESAEELVQDAFIRVHLRWARVESPRAFLRTAVVNVCRDRIRRRVRLRTRMPKLEGDVSARIQSAEATGDNPAAELHDVLLRLPLRQRTAIVGRFYCGWDDPTIAAVLDVRPSTVRSLVHRGLATLRTEIPR